MGGNLRKQILCLLNWVSYKLRVLQKWHLVLSGQGQWHQLGSPSPPLSCVLSNEFCCNIVLVCWGCYNNSTIGWVHKLQKWIASLFWGQRPRSRCQKGWCLVRVLPLACRWLLSHCVLIWPFLSVCEWRENSVVSLLRRTLILSDQGSTLRSYLILIISVKAPPLNVVTLGFRASTLQHTNFGRTQTSNS